MRIIAGIWRSRRLVFPTTQRTRPMPDRIRESIFDILASRFSLPGTLPPIRVADLFAGSGSMGLEAVSRGAASCDFLEKEPRALRALRQNLINLETDDRCRLIRADAWSHCLASPRPAETYGLIFIDPPYADSRDVSRTGRIRLLLSDLRRASWVDHRSALVLHHEVRGTFESGADDWWEVCDRRDYGSAGITFIEARRPREVETDESPSDDA